jgi:hypothetical protein
MIVSIGELELEVGGSWEYSVHIVCFLSGVGMIVLSGIRTLLLGYWIDGLCCWSQVMPKIIG